MRLMTKVTKDNVNLTTPPTTCLDLFLYLNVFFSPQLKLFSSDLLEGIFCFHLVIFLHEFLFHF